MKKKIIINKDVITAKKLNLRSFLRGGISAIISNNKKRKHRENEIRTPDFINNIMCIGE